MLEQTHWFNQEINKSGSEQIEVTGIDAEHVVDVVIGEFGQVPIDATILMLMDNGTVEYIPVRKALNEGFHSFGKIKGVEDVVRLRVVEESDSCTGGRDTIAQKANGDFYELYTLMRDLGIFD